MEKMRMEDNNWMVLISGYTVGGRGREGKKDRERQGEFSTERSNSCHYGK